MYIRFAALLFSLCSLCVSAQNLSAVRQNLSLNDDWQTVVAEKPGKYRGFEEVNYELQGWEQVNVPHNWDQYEGYRRLKHGNLHGTAWYRKSFNIEEIEQTKNQRYFLFFEGVGSYATVYLNGELVGEHAGGRTTFTLDVTDFINSKGENLLAVRADHPANITDLPWVCGGCSDEYGFSEGSQPLGIFRPVHLIVTNEVRITPFGVHIWNDTTVNENEAKLEMTTEFQNFSNKKEAIIISQKLVDKQGNIVAQAADDYQLDKKEKAVFKQSLKVEGKVNLWSVDNPYLYTMITTISTGKEILDQVENQYGIRWIKWDIAEGGSNRFFLNGKPVFINGTAEYEHNMGMSHAFTDEMVAARVSQMRQAGFNAFRDAHQPHNFRYHHAWDSTGMLWWTQMAAHIWYDTPAFKSNFEALMRDWVRERRNSPSVILWGLENESTIPKEFSEICTAIIREMDPTSPSQRLVTTCNGGEGTDWDVPQNWTGTYGGNPDLYDEDLYRQILVGEYGAWRTLDLHTEGDFDEKGVYSEDRMTQLMQKKVRLGASAADSAGGHFHWIFTSHENPGRNQSGEGLRELDRVGPVNYKGLLTPWGEPTDVYYMFRAANVDASESPMIYLVSHTWPNRWVDAGVKPRILAYSNCDSAALYNGDQFLGTAKNPGFALPFVWENVKVENSVLRAIGYVGGKIAAEDEIRLIHLKPVQNASILTADVSNENVIYRVNCGGDDVRDKFGHIWQADRQWDGEKTWGSLSWTDDFDDMPPYYASQRRTFDPIRDDNGKPAAQFYNTFRFGLTKLRFRFPVSEGKYKVRFHFVEPWYGTGGELDCENWRLFDVAVNGKVVIDDLDIWKQVGHDQTLVIEREVEIDGNELLVHFPEVKSGQGIISGLEIIALDDQVKPDEAAKTLFSTNVGQPHFWLDWGDQIFVGGNARIHELSPELFGAMWLKAKEGAIATIKLNMESDVYVAVKAGVQKPSWLRSYDDTKQEMKLAEAGRLMSYHIYKQRLGAGDMVSIKQGDFLVFAQKSAKLVPPYDLKPKVPYNEDVAKLYTKGLSKSKKYKFGCVVFEADAQQQVGWPIKTGVADYHAIHFKYSNETGAPIVATMRLVAADGTVMQETPIEFVITKVGKYKEITAYTDSMINAGTYEVQVVAKNASELVIRGIRVQ